MKHIPRTKTNVSSGEYPRGLDPVSKETVKGITARLNERFGKTLSVFTRRKDK